MSFAVRRYLKQLNILSCSRREVRVLSKLFIHCTAQSRQSDEENHKVNLVGPPDTPKSISKQDLISRAMQTYLERKLKSDEFLETNNAEFDLGKRHLANIMGWEGEEMSSTQIRKAIDYLLPSGLFNKKARPKMEQVSFYLPQSIGQEFDKTGRPKHFLYYTFKPKYYSLMHMLAYRMETLRRTDINEQHEDETDSTLREWVEFDKFSGFFEGEKVSEHDYGRFIALIQRFSEVAADSADKAFINRYRKKSIVKSKEGDLPKKHVDNFNRTYVLMKGKRKTASATVKLYSDGHGMININGKDITYFTEVIHRQTILAPLQLCGVMDKFDIVAKVKGNGPSGEAGAIRVCVAKALTSFVPEDVREQLRIAGYLSSDPRRRERKKPGQEKARKKFTWKRR